MGKAIKFKNGCVNVSSEGILIVKSGFEKFVPYSEITEVQILQPNNFRYGVLYIMCEDDSDTYVPLLDKRRTLIFNLSDSIIMARLRYKIEKEAGIVSASDMDNIDIPFSQKLKLINPVFILLSLWILSFMSLNREVLFNGIFSLVNGDAIAPFYANDKILAFLALTVIIGSVFLVWVVVQIFTMVSVHKDYKMLTKKRYVDSGNAQM